MLPTLGGRSFSAAAPKPWNSLPVEFRQTESLDTFQSKLKNLSFLYFLTSFYHFIDWNFIMFIIVFSDLVLAYII